MVRRVLGDILLEKKNSPTIGTIFQRITNLNVYEVEELKLFERSVLSPVDSPIGSWSRYTLYRFMISVGFIHGERVIHYE